MLDHVSLAVTDISRSRLFYDAVLRPLGLVRIFDFGEGRGSDYGASPGSPGVEFTITREAEVRTPIPGAHICFLAPDRAAVEAFHAAALAQGGRDDGPPGLSGELSLRLLWRLRVGPRRSSHRGGLSRADQPDHRRERLAQRLL